MTLTRVAIVALVWCAPFQIAHAEPTEGDLRILSIAKDRPDSGMVFAEVKIFEHGSSKPEVCTSIVVHSTSQQGSYGYLPVQKLTGFFGHWTEQSYGGWAVLSPGVYTITSVQCDTRATFKGPFAQFSVQRGKVFNLGSLVITYRLGRINLFSPRSAAGDWKVGDVSSPAVDSLKSRAPTAFSKAAKQYMIPVRATKPAQ